MTAHIARRAVVCAALCVGVACASVNAPPPVDSPMITLEHDEAAEKVDVYVDGDLFTSYLYTDDIPSLKKPVLYPIRTASGVAVTRGWPLDPRPGERADHPHHIGLWLNYGDVNGLDFWNNSGRPSHLESSGTIVHDRIASMEGGAGAGTLTAVSRWVTPDGEPLLEEETVYTFGATDDGARTIDRTTTLTALDEPVSFTDNKEGMLGLRLTRALEMPASRPINIIGPDGEPLDEPVLDNEGVTGVYTNSRGVSGYPDVWGQRAEWMTLQGKVEGQPVTIAIFDHPENVGYPTYWHARDYGLFAANPLGQEVFSEGAEELNFALEPGASTTFRHRVLLLPEAAAPERVAASYDQYLGMRD